MDANLGRFVQSTFECAKVPERLPLLSSEMKQGVFPFPLAIFQYVRDQVFCSVGMVDNDNFKQSLTLWVQLCLCGLTWCYYDRPDVPKFSLLKDISECQKSVIHNLVVRLKSFMEDNAGVFEYVNWPEELKTKTISYDGGEAYTAESFSWEQVKEALPPSGMAASI
eukprot:5466521-Karenia_brevis.AAC.1